MFDAKIITHYGANPYTNKPLDFPNDEWLRFMRWVHRYSPYGPLWIAYTLIPSVLGLGKFIITFITFKLSIGIFHILNTLFIYKTLEKLNNRNKLIGTAFYALNPLFLIEGVINAHNDIVHAFFIIITIYFLSRNKLIVSGLALLLGSLIKYLSIISVIPLVIIKLSKIKFEPFVLINLFCYLCFTFIFSSVRVSVPFISSGSLQTQFQPWYLFWSLPLISFLPKRKLFLVLAISLCFSALYRYLPFLFYGEWSKPGTVEFMKYVTLSIPAIAIIILLLLKLHEKIYQK